MDNVTSSKLAIRSLLKESKEKRSSSSLTEERAIVSQPSLMTTPKLDFDKKSQEHIELEKSILNFLEKSALSESGDLPIQKGRGRPSKEKKDKARNITLCLSRDHIELLDKANFGIKDIEGRGRKVRFIIDSFIKYQKREAEQIRAVQESLRIIGNNLEHFSKNYKSSDKVLENQKVLTDLEKSISNLRIILGLLKIESGDLRKYLNEKDYSTYEFSMSWLSNRANQ